MKRGGNTGNLKGIPEEGMVVRFLTEPDEWFEFFQHWDETAKRPAVCVDDCDYCADDVRVSKRALAAVVNKDDGTVQTVVLPSTLVSRLLNRYDKYGTMLDRDYNLMRSGKGTDTEYDVDPEAPSRMNLSRFEVPDLQEVLEEASGADDEDDEEEDEKPARRPTKKATSSKRRSQVDDDDEDEEDDEDDDEFLRPSRPARKAKSRPSSGSAGKSSLGKARVKPRANNGLRK